MFPDHSYGHFSVKEDGMLVIDQVQKEDAGMFICQAQSVAGSAVVKAELTVKGKITFFSLQQGEQASMGDTENVQIISSNWYVVMILRANLSSFHLHLIPTT